MSDNIDCKLINTRLQTIARLYDLADEIDKIRKHSKIALLTGTSASILGGVVALPLSVDAIVITGGAAAVPIAAGVFGGFGAAGGVTSFWAGLGGHLHIKAKHKEAMAAINADMDLGKQFLNYIKKAKEGREVLNGSKLARGTLSAVGGAAFAVEKGFRIAIRAGDAALDAMGVFAKVIKVAGCVSIAVNAILLPVDIYILVKNSKDIHKAKRHEKAEEIREWAKYLETSLPCLINFVCETRMLREEQEMTK